MRELEGQGEYQPWNMHHTSFDHPPVDVLERFALNNCSGDEEEMLVEHMLACESCSIALENLDTEIAAFKLALAPYKDQAKAPALEKTPWWKEWFTAPRLSLAGAALAACAFCSVALIPVNVELKAERGNEAVAIVPEWRSADLTLQGESVPAGRLKAEVVNEAGAAVWSGEAQSGEGQVVIHRLRMMHAGRYFARVYTAGNSHELLAEYPFEARLKF